jgi:hypothetical protein
LNGAWDTVGAKKTSFFLDLLYLGRTYRFDEKTHLGIDAKSESERETAIELVLEVGSRDDLEVEVGYYISRVGGWRNRWVVRASSWENSFISEDRLSPFPPPHDASGSQIKSVREASISLDFWY